MKKDIYIIKNSINDKVYIGQAKNAAERWLSHIYNAKYEGKTNKELYVIHKAMYKYGIDKFHYEILESQIENYDEREIYWIQYYNSRVPNGYNVAIGGSGMGYGTEHVNAIFKNNESLMQCISEISSTTKSFTNIAKKYNCAEEVISAINLGYRYKQDNLIYPLRDTNIKYSYDTVKQIRYSLKYEIDLTLGDIARKYDVNYSQVSAINNGKIYFLNTEEYPLRNKRKTDLSENTINAIVNDIIYSNLCLSDIASKYNVSRSRITEINKGNAHFNPELTYPLRLDNDSRTKSLKKFLSIEIIKEIHTLLEGDSSIRDIANKYDVSTTTICNINSGRCKKYILNKYKYPVRKLK